MRSRKNWNTVFLLHLLFVKDFSVSPDKNIQKYTDLGNTKQISTLRFKIHAFLLYKVTSFAYDEVHIYDTVLNNT